MNQNVARGTEAGEETPRNDGGLSQESGEKESVLRKNGLISFLIVKFVVIVLLRVWRKKCITNLYLRLPCAPCLHFETESSRISFVITTN